MTVLRNEGRWDRSNVLLRQGRPMLYDKSVADPAVAGMEHIDYGLSVLRRDVVLEEVAPHVRPILRTSCTA